MWLGHLGILGKRMKSFLSLLCFWLVCASFIGASYVAHAAPETGKFYNVVTKLSGAVPADSLTTVKVNLLPGDQLKFVGYGPTWGSNKTLKVEVISGQGRGNLYYISGAAAVNGTLVAAKALDSNFSGAAAGAPSQNSAHSTDSNANTSNNSSAVNSSAKPQGITAAKNGELMKTRSYKDAQMKFFDLQYRFKRAMAAKGLIIPLKDATPGLREAVFEVMNKFNPQEQAMLAMVGTSWAESRESSGNRRDSHDPIDKANKIFTMHMLKMRSEDTKKKYLIAKSYRDKGTALGVVGAVAPEGAFSSWNSGSLNFKNMVNALGGSVQAGSRVSLQATVNAYHDYSNLDVQLNGFSGPQGEPAHHMMNRTEIRNPAGTVSWSIEHVMGKTYKPKELEQAIDVGVRVKGFSISVRDKNAKLIKVSSRDIDHWPVYMAYQKAGTNMANWKKLKQGQGRW